MSISIGNTVEFRDTGGTLYACYHYDDPYKSFFRGLYTPKGCDVVAPQPPDHPHHKGLQYGLCAADVNFWEEDAKTEPGHRCIGRQVTVGKPEQFGNGFSQNITWRDDVCVSFNETRRISVQPATSGYAWRWETTLTAVRDVTLDISAWLVNGRGYVGLGLRPSPELFLKKSTVTLVPATGSVPQRVMVRGSKAALTFEQDPQQQNALYLQGCEPSSRDEFAFVSLGPTNAHGFTIKKGDSLEGSYLITVADVD